jgi:hypothetical protein
MYEHRRQPLLSRLAFLRRLARHGAVALALVVGSLLIGVVGYHAFEGLSWLDAFVNAAMLLGGMGPVTELRTPAGKLFAGLYALYSGLVFLVIVGVIFAPVIHRFLHYFQAEHDDHAAGAGSRRSKTS